MLDDDEANRSPEGGPGKQPWVEMKISYVGDISEILQGGGGKLSVSGGDTGDSRKPPGGG
jgi:hypothetical protein